MLRKSFCLMLGLLWACNPDADHPEFVELSGYVYQADGAAAQDVKVFVEIPYCDGWFCFFPDRIKTFQAKTDATGFYVLRLTDGHYGSQHAVQVWWPETSTGVNITLTLSAYEIRLPDLRQWDAQPTVRFFPEQTTDYVGVAWQPMPPPTKLPADEYWAAMTMAKPIFGNSQVPAPVWQGGNGVSIPTELLADTLISYIEIGVNQRATQSQNYEIYWNGGRVQVGRFLKRDLLSTECSLFERRDNKLQVTGGLVEGNFLYPMWGAWVACEFPDPITVSSVGWHGAQIGLDRHESDVEPEASEPSVDVFVFDTEVLPDEKHFGSPAASRVASFGYVQLASPKLARWLVLAPSDRRMIFQEIKAVRAW